MNNFDRIAPVYDWLAKSVFGRDILDAQINYVGEINANDHILIIGGGSGKILTVLDSLKLSLKVTYVEQSVKMIELAKTMAPFQTLEIDFIEGNEDSIPENQYDVLFTAFFLDVFKEDHLDYVVNLLYTRLKENGIWLLTDFVKTERIWQQVLIRLMYLFFRTTTGLEGSKLLDYDHYLQKAGMGLSSETLYFHGMMRSAVYTKYNYINRSSI